MAEVSEPLKENSKILKDGDPEETVMLRRDSHKLREVRRQSRQRTPTAMVSNAFNFLNEDLDSTVEVFGNGSFDIPELGQVQTADQSNDDSVCLRPDEDLPNIQGKNRRGSRQRTPTALVSQAFGFLNENIDSAVFENGPFEAAERNGQVEDNLCGDLLHEGISANSEDAQDLHNLRERRLKDSGFASLERQLDKDSIEQAFSEFKAESAESHKLDESDPVKSFCDPSQDEESEYKEKDTESSVLKENVSPERENTVSAKRDEPAKEHEPSKSSADVPVTSDTVQGIKERVALAMKVLEASEDDGGLNDEGNDDNEDKRVLSDLVGETNVTCQSEADDSQEVLSNVPSLPTYKDADVESSIKQGAESTTVFNAGAAHLSEPELVSSNPEVEAQSTEHTHDNIILEGTHEDNNVPEKTEVSKNSDIEKQNKRKGEGENEEVEPSKGASPEIDQTDSISTPNEDESKNIDMSAEENMEMTSSKIIRVERTDQASASTDDSSDEDTGIYAESFRRSNWIRVSKEGKKLSLHIPSSLPSTSVSSAEHRSQFSTVDAVGEEGEEDNEGPSSTSIKSNTDDVFMQSDPDSKNKIHKRSYSTTSTSSEAEFKRQYVSRRKCLIQRADSQQEYHRLSARIYEENKEVVLERNSECQDLGLHLLDSHPAFITSVDPGSPADKAGIVEGQILVSVNDVSVLTTNHDDIVELIQKCEGNISIGVANSDFQPVRDLQSPVIAGYLYKLGHSSLMRMWKKRYFILRHDNCLYYYKTEQDLDPLGALPLCGYTISRHTETNKDFCFKAEKYGARSYFFMTDNRDQMTEWVGAMTQAAVRSKKRKENFLSVSSHNVSLPALDIRRPECSGYLGKLVNRSWGRRYCVLKDACIYYYKDVNSLSALGVAHLHGYTVDVTGHAKKKNSFCLLPPDPKMRTFYFSVDNDTDKKRWVEALIHSIQRWVRVDN